ncbi:Crp/Fnr family transcriptional regulator [Flavobacterium silvaticum]|uniref:Crp/Fnr family transcriptional regulator n=1 Tax=Flavobacterium silvaticum TaxID=1852020 RepID=A0A972FRF5_9FLAO|nr:Crp/Fnr family transcriptional regulator [Flavobacterium silvaticum]NMH27128.1 Crp/Fnr family transcriptional regulator [Flavobacterium silvaticum]
MSKCEQCIVRQLSAIKALGKEELLRMADCKTSSTVRKGENLFEEGDHIDGIFCIKDGACKLTKLSANGNSQIVKLAKKGELLGQRSVISGEPANLSAVALEDMEVCFIPSKDITAFLDQNPQFSRSMMQTLSKDLKDADNILVGMAQKTAKQRLAEVLLNLEKTFGTDADGYISLQLSREEMAGMIGTVLESCIRLLSEFKNERLVALEGKKIRICDKAGLERRAYQ